MSAAAAPCPLFVELCAGTAATALQLIGGRKMRPALGWQGCKQGYAHAILAHLGLRPGQGAAKLLLVDASPWGAAHASLFSPAGAAAMATRALAHWQRPGTEDDHWLQLRESWRAGMGNADQRAADWLYLCRGSFQLMGPYSSIGSPGGRPDVGTFGSMLPAAVTVNNWLGRWRAARPWRLTQAWALQADVRAVAPPAVLPVGTRVYIDPPYGGTSGYQGCTLPRAAVLALALAWHAAGARVAVSEAVPLPLPGWRHIDIAATRRGKRRTWADTQEWLTLSPVPQ